MNPKQKLIFGAVAAACGLVIVGLLVQLILSIGAMNEAREARENAEATLTDYYRQKPYPSKVNRETRLADAEKFAAVSEATRTLLTATLDYPRQESPSQFVQRMGETLKKLDARKNITRVEIIEKATKTKTASAETVMDYSFGKYVGQGELPKEADVPRLAKQFAIIEHVCTMVLDAGALDITHVTREMFEAATAKPVEETAKRGRSSKRNKKEAAKTPVATTGVTLPEDLVKDGVTAEPFTIAFRSNYATLAKVLNALNTDDLFIVVTDLAFKNKVDLRSRVSEMVKRREAVRLTAARKTQGRDAAEVAVAKDALFETASPAERLLTDPENAVPLEVTLKFEVYSAAPSDAAESADK